MFPFIGLFPGDVTGQFTALPPTCPGDTFTFRCTVGGYMSGYTIWRVDGGSSECSLTHTTIDGPRVGLTVLSQLQL